MKKQQPSEAARRLAADLLAGRLTIEEALKTATPAPPTQRSRGVAQPYRRGNVWWVQYSVDGRRIRETTGSTNLAVARKVLKDRIARVERREPVGTQIAKTTFEDLESILLADYEALHPRSLAHAKMAFNRMRGMFAHTRAANITKDRLTQYVAQQQREGYLPATIKLDLSLLKRSFHLAEESHKVGAVPRFPKVRVDNARKGFFEFEEFTAVLAHLPDDLKPLFSTAYHTGWRTARELLTRTVGDLDYKTGMLHLDATHSKNHDTRDFPFTEFPELRAVLDRQVATIRDRAQGGNVVFMEAPKDAWLFQRQGTAVQIWDREADPGRDSYPIRTYVGAWKAACRKTGVARDPHDFRRTAVRNLVRAGVAEKTAMIITGHKTRSVFDRYDIVTDEDRREAVRKLARRHAEQAATVAQIPRLPQFQPQSGEMTPDEPAQKAENA